MNMATNHTKILANQETINNIRLTNKPQRFNFGGGLAMTVKARTRLQDDDTCCMYWVHEFSYKGKRYNRSLGAYGDPRAPKLPLAGFTDPRTSVYHPGARDLHKQNMLELQQGKLPGLRIKARNGGGGSGTATKCNHKPGQPRMFEAVAREWHQNHCTTRHVSAKHVSDTMARLTMHVFPHQLFQHTPLPEITAPKIGVYLQQMELALSRASCDKIVAVLMRVFQYADDAGYIDKDPTQHLSRYVTARETAARHQAAIIDPPKIGELLRSIKSYGSTSVDRDMVIKALLQLSALTMLRSKEIREAQWSEIDLGRSRWTVPGSRMKRTVGDRTEPHIVMLSQQAIDALRDLHRLTGSSTFMFPAKNNPNKPIHNKGILEGLRRCGVPADQMTGHGFRAMGSTSLQYLYANKDWREMCLDHTVFDSNRHAYGRADFLQERLEVMQVLADYYDHLADGGAHRAFKANWTMGREVQSARAA